MKPIDKQRLKLAGCLAGGLLGLVGTAKCPDQYKIIPTGLTAGFGVASYVLSRDLETRELLGEDSEVSKQLVNQLSFIPGGLSGSLGASQGTPADALFLDTDGNPLQTSLGSIKSLPQYNWKRMLKDRNGNAFIGLLAAQGAGKTSLMNYLQTLNQGTVQIGITPHLDPETFPAADYRLDLEMEEDEIVFGEDGFKPDPDLTLTDLLARSKDGVIREPIYQIMLSTMAEYKLRRKQKRQGQTEFKPIDIWLDEGNEIYGEFKQFKPEHPIRKFWGNFIRKAMQAFRKYKIRLIIAAQASTVKELGMENLSTLKESYTWIRIGKPATEYAKGVDLTPAQKELLNKADRPLMVGEVPAQPPAWEVISGAIAVAQLERFKAGKTPAATVPGNAYSDPQDSQEAPSGGQRVQTPSDRRQEALRALQEGMSMSTIIKEVWGFKGPNYRKKGMPLWDELGLPKPEDKKQQTDEGENEDE